MNKICLILSSYIVSKQRYGPLNRNIEKLTTSNKIIKHDNINNLCLYLKLEQLCKLYFPGTFQTSDIEILSPKIVTKYTSHSLTQVLPCL